MVTAASQDYGSEGRCRKGCADAAVYKTFTFSALPRSILAGPGQFLPIGQQILPACLIAADAYDRTPPSASGLAAATESGLI